LLEKKTSKLSSFIPNNKLVPDLGVLKTFITFSSLLWFSFIHMCVRELT